MFGSKNKKPTLSRAALKEMSLDELAKELSLAQGMANSSSGSYEREMGRWETLRSEGSPYPPPSRYPWYEEYQPIIERIKAEFKRRGIDNIEAELSRRKMEAISEIKAQAAKARIAPEIDDKIIGNKMADGTIYAGISPDTRKPMYTTPEDAPGTYTFNPGSSFHAAANYAESLVAHGHYDFRVPSKGELNVLYQNRNKGWLKGTFNETGSYPAGWYCSSSPTSQGIAWAQRFSDGSSNDSPANEKKTFAWSLRCVR